MTDDADRRLADLREPRDPLVKLIGRRERGASLRPLGQDPVEASALHSARLEAEKASADEPIPRLKAMRGTREGQR